MFGYSILQLLIIIIAVAAAIAITVVIVRAMGVAIPPAFDRVFWILLLAFVGIMALIFLFRLVGQMGSS